MKVSVITVCFNANASIEACLESVANQTYSDIEHIVIDGGSTDGTIATVRRYPHIATVVSEPDSGIYNAMNKGISRATGEYLLFLNADDRFPKPDALEAAMAAIRNMPDADVIYGGLHVRGEDGSSHIFPTKQLWRDDGSSGGPADSTKLTASTPITTGT
jgi:glycosyltransferase involved in cell wall biosynthesis